MGPVSSLRSSGLVPGRAPGAVLDKADGEGRGRDDDCFRTIKRRDSETSGRWRNGAHAECGTGATGGVWLFPGLGVCRIGIDEGVVLLTSLLAVMSMGIDHVLVDLRAHIARILAGLRMSRTARHTAACNRMQRKHGQQ